MTCMENCADTNNNLILNKLPEDERQAIPLGYNNQFLLSLSIHISQREEEAEGKIQGESTGSKNHCGCLQSLLTIFFIIFFTICILLLECLFHIFSYFIVYSALFYISLWDLHVCFRLYLFLNFLFSSIYWTFCFARSYFYPYKFKERWNYVLAKTIWLKYNGKWSTSQTHWTDVQLVKIS